MASLPYKRTFNKTLDHAYNCIKMLESMFIKYDIIINQNLSHDKIITSKCLTFFKVAIMMQAIDLGFNFIHCSFGIQL